MSKITYDREESILRGQVPLHKFKVSQKREIKWSIMLFSSF